MDRVEAPSIEEREAITRSPAWGDWPGESSKARQALEDYWAMGATRSITKLLRNYEIAKGRGEEVPGSSSATLTKWRRAFSWADRIRLRESERHAGLVDEFGVPIRRSHTIAKKEEEDAKFDEEVGQTLKVLRARRDDLKTSASALPAICRLIADILGRPFGERVGDDMVSLPPGQPPLTFQEDEYLAAQMNLAIQNALKDIMRRREEVQRTSPIAPLALLDEEAAGG